jgi:DNA polymerase-3 subunit epsilon
VRSEQPVPVPLLIEMGIHTLGQAREAAQKAFYARVKY